MFPIHPLRVRSEMRENLPALFLDRDGVVNHDLGYVHKSSDFIFFDQIFEICHLVMEANWPIAIITNQSGIGTGRYSERDFLLLTQWMNKKFAERGIHIAKVVYASEVPPHVPNLEQTQSRRKPSPIMFFEVAYELQIDLSRSIMVGDSEIDMVAALRAGIPHRYLISPNAKESVASMVGRNHDECRIWLEQVIQEERNRV